MEAEFIRKCKAVVRDYCNHNPSKPFQPITIDDVRVIWFNKSFTKMRALLVSIIPDDTYYELTYDFGTDKIYVDLYRKSIDRVVIDYLAING